MILSALLRCLLPCLLTLCVAGMGLAACGATMVAEIETEFDAEGSSTGETAGGQAALGTLGRRETSLARVSVTPATGPPRSAVQRGDRAAAWPRSLRDLETRIQV